MRSNFLWSVRREFWEHRWAIFGPGAIAIVGLIAWVTHLDRFKAIATLDAPRRVMAMAVPYSMAASVILLVGFVIGVWYSTEALSNERRDRSILFWKSMPVSDLTTVLAKSVVPFVLIPASAFVIALVTQLLMLATSLPVLPIQSGELHLGRMTVVMAYGVFVHMLWYAPIYAYVIMVSAWARRAVFVWAMLPFAALVVAEKLSLGSAFVASVLRYRLLGAMQEAFTADALKTPVTQLSQLEPARFFSGSNLWLGLAIAAACLAAAVRLRRTREPN